MPKDDGGFSVFFLGLSGGNSCGDPLKQSYEMALDALDLFLLWFINEEIKMMLGNHERVAHFLVDVYRYVHDNNIGLDKIEAFIQSIKGQKVGSMGLVNVICLDIEATGTDYHLDEVLQVSIIDCNSNEVLFNEYMKPDICTSWQITEGIHGITPEFVENCNNFEYYKNLLQSIFDDAEMIVGFSHMSFDIPFLKSKGIHFRTGLRYYDVSKNFRILYQNNSGSRHRSLVDCSKILGYSDFKAHDSLEDVKATIYCYCKLMSEYEQLSHDKKETHIKIKSETDITRFDRSINLCCYDLLVRLEQHKISLEENLCYVKMEWIEDGFIAKAYYATRVLVTLKSFDPPVRKNKGLLKMLHLLHDTCGEFAFVIMPSNVRGYHYKNTLAVFMNNKSFQYIYRIAKRRLKITAFDTYEGCSIPLDFFSKNGSRVDVRNICIANSENNIKLCNAFNKNKKIKLKWALGKRSIEKTTIVSVDKRYVIEIA